MKPVKLRFASVVLALAALMLSVTSCRAVAGIALGATRVVYPAGQKQVSLPVSSSDADGAFLIQSWVENAQDQKDTNLIVTPPLFMMQGKKEKKISVLDERIFHREVCWLGLLHVPHVSGEVGEERGGE